MEEKDNRIVVPTGHKFLDKFGGYGGCLAIIEKEKRPIKLLKVIKAIDAEFDAHFSDDLKTLMYKVVKDHDRTLITLAGYAHLLLAESMIGKKFSKEEINLELDKAIAILDVANRGGNHPLLPRAVSLKRRLNLRKYIRFCLTVIAILIFITFWFYMAKKMMTKEFDFF